VYKHLLDLVREIATGIFIAFIVGFLIVITNLVENSFNSSSSLYYYLLLDEHLVVCHGNRVQMLNVQIRVGILPDHARY